MKGKSQDVFVPTRVMASIAKVRAGVRFASLPARAAVEDCGIVSRHIYIPTASVTVADVAGEGHCLLLCLLGTRYPGSFPPLGIYSGECLSALHYVWAWSLRCILRAREEHELLGWLTQSSGFELAARLGMDFSLTFPSPEGYLVVATSLKVPDGAGSEYFTSQPNHCMVVFVNNNHYRILMGRQKVTLPPTCSFLEGRWA